MKTRRVLPSAGTVTLIGRKLASAEGVAYGSVADRHVTGLDLDHQSSFLSNRLFRKELFWGKASEYDRRHRRNTARSQAVMSHARFDFGVRQTPRAGAADAGRLRAAPR